MPNKVTLTLTVGWVKDKEGVKCVAETQVYMKKGNRRRLDKEGHYCEGDQTELEIVLNDESDGATVLLLSLTHGRPEYYFESPPLFPLIVSPAISPILTLKENMGLASRPDGAACFGDEVSPYAQLIKFKHVDACTNQELDHCVGHRQHTSVHIEC